MSNASIRFLNALGLLGITFVLGMGVVLQVVWDELPCPLCLLQRVAFALVMFGFMLNVMRGLSFRHYGVIIFGALYGAGVALRQVTLHVVPGSGSYGSPILGMHFYTWAFLIFSATLLATGVLLVLSRDRQDQEQAEVSKVGRLICWAAVIVVAINAISTFLECGPLVCADNPVSYKLLS